MELLWDMYKKQLLFLLFLNIVEHEAVYFVNAAWMIDFQIN